MAVEGELFFVYSKLNPKPHIKIQNQKTTLTTPNPTNPTKLTKCYSLPLKAGQALQSMGPCPPKQSVGGRAGVGICECKSKRMQIHPPDEWRSSPMYFYYSKKLAFRGNALHTDTLFRNGKATWWYTELRYSPGEIWAIVILTGWDSSAQKPNIHTKP